MRKGGGERSRVEGQGQAAKSDKMEIEGVVKETLPNATFLVEIEVGGQKHDIHAHVSGKIRMHFIKILPGDRVLVELTSYDPTKGRILYRYK